MPGRLDVLKRAAPLSFGVVAYLHVRHMGAAHEVHALLDGALALPLAMACVWSLGRLRVHSVRALAVALSFCALLVPASAVHGLIHSGGDAGHVHASEPVAAHGAREAAAAFPVALAIAALTSRTPSAHRRRRAALAAAIAVLATSLPVAPAAAMPLQGGFLAPLPIPPELSGPDVTLTAAETDVQIASSGPATKMWTFNGTFPGPTIRMTAGTTTRVTVQNDLPASMPAPRELTLHHHGNHSAASEDGHPHHELIDIGEQRTYTYELMEDGKPERAAFQWYHDHRMDATARNVWMGLAGMVILDPAPTDPEAALNLPSGAYDVPIMLADRSFVNNQIDGYSFDPNGVLGDTLLANGAPQPYFQVEQRRYRLRFLNASNTRAYMLSLSNNAPMTQIAAESGLLPAPVPRQRIRLEPAERAEIVLDFSTYAPETKIVLRNEFGFGPVSQVLQFDVTGPPASPDNSVVPLTFPHAAPDFGGTLTPPSVSTEGGEVHLDGVRRVFALTQTGIDSPVWTINGLEFEHDRIDAYPVLGTVENWVFVNTTSVNHVVHIHDVDWHVLLRTGGIAPNTAADPGESGLKESFLVRPFETVEVAARFTDHLGVYVFHCHILEHEDRAMMAQFEVVEPAEETYR